MTQPFLSFCIPTYNRWHLLEPTLESILCAAKMLAGSIPYEIVVSDNASTDRTRECAHRFSLEPNIHYSRRPTTIPSSANLLFVCSQAKGEFLWLLGDDDPMLPGAARALVDLIEKSTVDYIFVPRVLVNSDLSAHPCGLQPAVAACGARFFATGVELFADSETEFPRLIGFYGANVVRRSVWKKAIADLHVPVEALVYHAWGHVRIILHAIRNRPCAMLGVPGVRGRLNPAPGALDSHIWLDEGIRLLQEAESWGYPPKAISQEIQFCMHAHARMFVRDKMIGRRKGDLTGLAAEFGCLDLLDTKDPWVRLSKWPLDLMAPVMRPALRIRRYLSRASVV